MSSAEPISYDATKPYRVSHEGRYHILISIVAPALLAVFFALALHYGVVDPSGPVVQLTPDFSLPLMVTIFTPLGVASVIFITVEVALYKRLAKGWREALPVIAAPFIRRALFPGVEDTSRPPSYAPVLLDCDGREDYIGLIKKQPVESQKKPWVILFHGNEMTANDMVDLYGEQYFDRGYNVFSAEISGYGGSKRSVNAYNHELEVSKDAKRILNYLINEKGVDKEKVLVHGYSQGGFVGSSLASDVGALVLDRTGTSFADTIHHIIHGEDVPKFIRKMFPSLTTKLFCRQLAHAAFKTGTINVDGLSQIRTDAFNTEAKLARAHIENPDLKLCLLLSKGDALMPYNSERFAKAHLGEENMENWEAKVFHHDLGVSHVGDPRWFSSMALTRWNAFRDQFYKACESKKSEEI